MLRRDFLLDRVVPGEAVLDLGCGLGDFAGELAAHGGLVTGCDVAETALALARGRHPGIEFVLTGAEELPFADESFDVVWAGEVLEHVQDLLGLLGEVRRVLRPGGRLLLSTPAHGAPRRLWLGLSRRAFEATFDPRSDHVRFFTSRSLGQTLAAAGFGPPVLARRAGIVLASTARD